MIHIPIDTFWKLSDGTFKFIGLLGILGSLIYHKRVGKWPWDK